MPRSVGRSAPCPGILISQGVVSGFAHGLVSVAVVAVVALLIGAISAATPARVLHHDHPRVAQMLLTTRQLGEWLRGVRRLNAPCALGLQLGQHRPGPTKPLFSPYVALAVRPAAMFALARFRALAPAARCSRSQRRCARPRRSSFPTISLQAHASPSGHALAGVAVP